MLITNVSELVNELEYAALGFAATSNVDRCLKAKADLNAAYGMLLEHNATLTSLVASSKPLLFQAIKDHVLLQGMTKVCENLQQEVEVLTAGLAEAKSRLAEVSVVGTRSDDLPYETLVKFDPILEKR